MAKILCPRCEKPHGNTECPDRLKLGRRFFLGMLGLGAAAALKGTLPSLTPFETATKWRTISATISMDLSATGWTNLQILNAAGKIVGEYRLPPNPKRHSITVPVDTSLEGKTYVMKSDQKFAVYDSDDLG